MRSESGIPTVYRARDGQCSGSRLRHLPIRAGCYAADVRAALLCVLLALNAQAASVPYVGCKSDGQVGPLEVPKGAPKQVQVTKEVAAKLAYYKAGFGGGVLAPRWWHCFGVYGSGGSALFVSGQPIDCTKWFSSADKGFAGPYRVRHQQW